MQDKSRLNITNSVLYESLGESLGLKDWCKLLGLTREQEAEGPDRQTACTRQHARKHG